MVLRRWLAVATLTALAGMFLLVTVVEPVRSLARFILAAVVTVCIAGAWQILQKLSKK